MTGFLALIITFILVIGLHEAGHALAARIFNVRIQRISLGFGKPLLKWQRQGGIEWIWAWWPLGGYVQLLNSRIQPVTAAEIPFCFDKRPPWQRGVILLAGVVANLLVAVAALTLMFMLGFKQFPPIVENVKPDSLAALAGIRAGDKLISIGQEETASWQDAGMQLIPVLGQANVRLCVEDAQHHQRQVQLDLRNWHFPKHKGSLLALLGIDAGSMQAHQQWVNGESFPRAFLLALHKSAALLMFFALMLKQLLTGVIPFSLLLGPMGLIAVSIGSWTQGLSVFMYFIASLSLSVGFINSLPLPGLDGGSLLYTLVEKLRGRPISVAMEILLYRLVTILFILIFIQLILNDLQRYLHA